MSYRHKVRPHSVFGDSFEPILALAFACYVSEKCEGVIYFSDSGESYYTEIKQAVTKLIDEFYNNLSPDTLLSHRFEGWH